MTVTCLWCNRSLLPTRRQQTVALLAQKLSKPSFYPNVYQLLSSLPFCPACLEALPWLGSSHCERCGREMDIGPVNTCGDCVSLKGEPLRMNRSVLSYTGMARELIHRLKYQRDERWSSVCGRLLAIGYSRYYRQVPLSCVSYVPMHHSRQRERGFNQALEMAAGLAEAVKIPLVPLLIRTVSTEKQSKQRGREARLSSMEGAFAIEEQVDVGRVRALLLIDDIYTTGATLRSCARTLAESRFFQSAAIYSLTLCR